MNKELAKEQLRDLEEIRSYVNMASQSCKFHRPGVTTKLLKLRETVQKAKQEAESVYRESYSQ